MPWSNRKLSIKKKEREKEILSIYLFTFGIFIFSSWFHPGFIPIRVEFSPVFSFPRSFPANFFFILLVTKFYCRRYVNNADFIAFFLSSFNNFSKERATEITTTKLLPRQKIIPNNKFISFPCFCCSCSCLLPPPFPPPSPPSRC